MFSSLFQLHNIILLYNIAVPMGVTLNSTLGISEPCYIGSYIALVVLAHLFLTPLLLVYQFHLP